MLALAERSDTNWSALVFAFLAEKEQRTGSRRTVETYGWNLSHFFDRVRCSPDQVTPAQVFDFAYSPGPTGAPPSPSYVRLRLAALSSFYRFLARMGWTGSNPVDRVNRPAVRRGKPRGLSLEQVRALLDALPATPVGIRDRAIILTCLYTGRRRSEVLSLRVGALSRTSDGTVYYTYRGKGGKVGTRELPPPVYEAIQQAHSKPLEELPENLPLFGISSQGFYLNFRRHLRRAKIIGRSESMGVHVLRHTAAKLRRDGGASIEDISHFLDHTNLAITSEYLRRLEGTRDSGWQQVQSLLG